MHVHCRRLTKVYELHLVIIIADIIKLKLNKFKNYFPDLQYFKIAA